MEEIKRPFSNTKQNKLRLRWFGHIENKLSAPLSKEQIVYLQESYILHKKSIFLNFYQRERKGKKEIYTLQREEKQHIIEQEVHPFTPSAGYINLLIHLIYVLMLQVFNNSLYLQFTS